MKKIFAFPFIENTRDNYGNVHLIQHNGMELRDYFAAQAMQGMLAADNSHTVSAEKVAVWAYDQADAMLSYRREKNGND
jgi:hypothetical protein